MVSAELGSQNVCILFLTRKLRSFYTLNNSFNQCSEAEASQMLARLAWNTKQSNKRYSNKNLSLFRILLAVKVKS